MVRVWLASLWSRRSGSAARWTKSNRVRFVPAVCRDGAAIDDRTRKWDSPPTSTAWFAKPRGDWALKKQKAARRAAFFVFDRTVFARRELLRRRQRGRLRSLGGFGRR